MEGMACRAVSTPDYSITYVTHLTLHHFQSPGTSTHCGSTRILVPPDFVVPPEFVGHGKCYMWTGHQGTTAWVHLFQSGVPLLMGLSLFLEHVVGSHLWLPPQPLPHRTHQLGQPSPHLRHNTSQAGQESSSTSAQHSVRIHTHTPHEHRTLHTPHTHCTLHTHLTLHTRRILHTHTPCTPHTTYTYTHTTTPHPTHTSHTHTQLTHLISYTHTSHSPHTPHPKHTYAHASHATLSTHTSPHTHTTTYTHTHTPRAIWLSSHSYHFTETALLKSYYKSNNCLHLIPWSPWHNCYCWLVFCSSKPSPLASIILNNPCSPMSVGAFLNES